jgi:PAS domain S-box-containing protein
MIQEQIKHSELTFQLIVESSPNAIVLVNKEGKIAYINMQTEKLFGYARAELIGQFVELLIPKRYHEHHSGFRTMFFNAPTVRAMGVGRELFAIKKDETEFPIEIGLNPVVTVDGTLVLASIIDITERKKAEARFRLVVESAPNAMILINIEGVITLVNTQAEKLFGYSRKELIGSMLETLIPERFRKQHPGHRGGFFKAPEVRLMGVGRDLFGLRKDGSEIQVEIGLNPIDTDEGQMVLASIIDITERKIQESILIRQNELEIRNKELEQFAFLASHDLQEPLRTVCNYIQVIEEDYGDLLDDLGKGYLKTIESATQRMSTLVRVLLNFSRLGRDKKLVTADCKQIVNDVLADLESLINTTKTSVDVGPLPKLNVYETELRQLFQNLISNAIKFSKEGVPAQIQIRHHKESDHSTFSVTDNGIGIDQIHFERVFNIFQRLHSDGAYEGYGIGLANCKKIVELHGGKIWLESELGRGSTFYFNVPNLNL